MANKKSDLYRNRKHMLLLYPDNPDHVLAMEKVKQSYDYAGILHNRDAWTEEDEKKNPDHVAGELKKPHWHVVIRTKNSTWNSAICKELGIEIKFCEEAKNIDKALQYLIHYNDNDKTLYDLEADVFGPLKTKLRESIVRDQKSEGEKVGDLIAYIKAQSTCISITDFAIYCSTNGYWSDFRRNATIFIKIIDEHNNLRRYS